MSVNLIISFTAALPPDFEGKKCTFFNGTKKISVNIILKEEI